MARALLLYGATWIGVGAALLVEHPAGAAAAFAAALLGLQSAAALRGVGLRS